MRYLNKARRSLHIKTVKMKTKLIHEHLQNTVLLIATACAVFFARPLRHARTILGRATRGPSRAKNNICTWVAVRPLRRRRAHCTFAMEASLEAWWL